MVGLVKNRIVWVAAVVVAVSLAGAGIAAAQEPTAQSGPLANDRLENFYQRATLAAQMVQLRLDFANKIAARVDELIAKANGEGKDTSALDSALAAFKSAIGASQASLDKAKALLGEHAGFDANGKVTDADRARTTLRSVRDALHDSVSTLREGGRDFKIAFRAWRKANQPQPTAPAQP